MQLTVCTWDDRVVGVEVDPDETVENLKAILEAETSLPTARQSLFYGGRQLNDRDKISQSGISEGDVIMLLPLQQQASSQPRDQQSRSAGRERPNPAIALNPDGSAVSPAAFIHHLKQDPGVLLGVQQNNPRLAKAIRDEDVEVVQEELRRVHNLRQEHEQELKKEQELLAADPFDPEAQRRIEELIQRKNIEENLAAALESSPEVFAQVEMLFVPMEVNGVPVKTFVDSGAQTTIMTYTFAEQCYLTRLIDKRFAGVAVGVGQSRIIGRIHQAPLKVAGHYVTSSITVLEQRDGPQFIFGLDMLKRHQCCIDLARNVLHFGSCQADLPFLPEHEIPRDFKRHIELVSKEDAEKSMAEAQRDAPAAVGPPPGTSTNVPSGAPLPPGAPEVRAVPSGGVDDLEAKVTTLVALGYGREECLAALRAAGGNPDLAAAILFGGM